MSNFLGGGGTKDHSELNGLANDDHTQYLLTNGTRSATSITLTDGSSASTTGLIKTPNNQTIVTARNNTDASDWPILGTNTTGILLGHLTDAPSITMQSNGNISLRSNSTFILIRPGGSTANLYLDGGGTLVTNFRPNSSSAMMTETIVHNGAYTNTWSEGVTGVTYQQSARTTDAACSDITIASQAPFASATGANRNPGNILLKVPAKASGGTSGYIRNQIGSTDYIDITGNEGGDTRLISSGTTLRLAVGGNFGHGLRVGNGVLALSETTVETLTVTASRDLLSTVEFSNRVNGVTISNAKRTGTGANAGGSITLSAQDGQDQTGAANNNNGGNIVLTAGAAGTGGAGAAGSNGSIEFNTAGGGTSLLSISRVGVSTVANSSSHLQLTTSQNLQLKSTSSSNEVGIYGSQFNWYTHNGLHRRRVVHDARSTTDATSTESSALFGMTNNTSLELNLIVTAQQTGGTAGTVGDSASWRYVVTAKCVSSIASIVETATLVHYKKDTGATNWTVEAFVNTTDNNIRARVKGEVDKTIAWMVWFEVTGRLAGS